MVKQLELFKMPRNALAKMVIAEVQFCNEQMQIAAAALEEGRIIKAWELLQGMINYNNSRIFAWRGGVVANVLDRSGEGVN
jgi:hypothetical protein